MKITVTKSELLRILSAHFNQEITECTICKSTGPCKIEVLLAKELGLPHITQSNISGANKIPAIKALRTVVADNLGLAEAKWAVENWEKWIGFVRSKDRVPKFNNGNIWNDPHLI
jgi:ribosomal protein L7/L12